MGRLTEFFGWRDTPPGDLTKLWCDHNLSFINIDKDDLKRLRKARLKHLRDENKRPINPSKKQKTQFIKPPIQQEVDWGDDEAVF